jgi:hypothetical protein
MTFILTLPKMASKSKCLKSSKSSYASVAGGQDLFYRKADWYGTSSGFAGRFKFLHEETHMCAISILNRRVININPSPDPDATFSPSLRNESYGNRIVALDTGLEITPEDAETRNVATALVNDDPVFKCKTQVWVYVDESKFPLVVESFAPDFKSVTCTASVVGGYIDAGFENTKVVIYRCRFVRVAISPLSYGTWAAGVVVYDSPAGIKRARVNLTAMFPKDYLGNYPSDLYVRMAKLDKSTGTWTDFVPLNPLRVQWVDLDGMARIVVEDLDLNSKYSAFITDVTIYPTDSGANLERKRNLRTCLNDKNDKSSVYFWNANILNQPQRPCVFKTPSPNTSDENVSFMTGSCYAGTLDALKGIEKYDHDLRILNGDLMYQDFSEVDADFLEHYKAWAKNEYGWNTLVSSGSYCLLDDHEVGDNWYRNIVLNAGNTSEFQFNAAENALYAAMQPSAANNYNNNNFYQVMFRKTNQFPLALASNTRIDAGIRAAQKFFGGRPDGVGMNDSWTVSHGKCDFIFINSNAFYHPDGSVEYFARRARVSAAGVVEFLPEPGTYIPGPSMTYLKQALQSSTADARCVFFSSDVSLIFNESIMADIKAKFAESALAAMPTVTPEVIESTWIKSLRAYNYDNPEGYAKELSDLISWMKTNKIQNTFFFTGDPHSSKISVLDDDNVIVSACLSSVSTYRASGYYLMLSGNLDKDNTILTRNNNSWGDVLFNPKERTMTIALKEGDSEADVAVIQLLRPKNRGYLFG